MAKFKVGDKVEFINKESSGPYSHEGFYFIDSIGRMKSPDGRWLDSYVYTSYGDDNPKTYTREVEDMDNTFQIVQKEPLFGNLEDVSTNVYRMYTIVLTALNPMQKGVQALHSVIEYSNKFGDDDVYTAWARRDKTEIILEGGTSQDMTELEQQLNEYGVKYALFKEEDLYNLVTAISFIVPEKIYKMDKDEFEEEFCGLINDSDISESDYNALNLKNIINSKRLAR